MSKMANILIIDDNEDFRLFLKTAVSDTDRKTDYALTIKDGTKMAFTGDYDVVFLDIHLPDGDGLDCLPIIKSAPSKPEVIIITGEDDHEGAKIAIRNGAWDYLKKPFSLDVITLQLNRVFQYLRGKKKATEVPRVLKRKHIIGESAKIKDCLNLVSQASLSDINVLITGETGTGKECFASAIHENSKRALGNFTIVDCAALPESLVESTLFGYVKGAFTGADRNRDGLISQADGGTLFPKHLPEHIRINMHSSHEEQIPSGKISIKDIVKMAHGDFPNIKDFREKVIAENEKNICIN
jgi:two-component system, NtrC family, response regulator